MKTIPKLAIILVVLFGGAVVAANRQAVVPPQSEVGDAPELSALGAFAVGTEVKAFDLPNRPRITLAGAITGRLPVETRSLKVRFWYPADTSAGAGPITYRHVFQSPGKPDTEIVNQGFAVANAPPRSGERFPLVLLSHGYRGWASHFSNLAETLASKGYVVASIEHEDAAFTSVTSFQMSFGNVILDRSADQRQILTQVLGQASAASSGSLSLVDAEHIALLGYSMGGFGAINTAGGAYDATSKTITQLPASAQRAVSARSDDVSSKIKALILLAPWGAQPENRSWSAPDLAKVTMPVLMISGDQDDIVDFKQGVSWLFDQFVGADRRLLVFQNARHNIGGNPVQLAPNADFTTREFFTEPVWRNDRINQINAHFISAFLDVHLKGDARKAAYLNPPTSLSNQGNWPTKLGEQVGGRFAGSEQEVHWRGFQRRWAVGLEMRHAPAGQAPTSPIETLNK